MDPTNARLVEPSTELREEFLSFRDEFRLAGEPDIHGVGPMKGDDFERALTRTREVAAGIGLPSGWAPASTFWLLASGRTVIGTINIRHGLTPELLYENGNIGYSVRPSERGKGLGTLMLRLGLAKARELGLHRVLVTCDKDNPASAAVIRKNRGVLENEVVSNKSAKLVQRYWIEL